MTHGGGIPKFGNMFGFGLSKKITDNSFQANRAHLTPDPSLPFFKATPIETYADIKYWSSFCPFFLETKPAFFVYVGYAYVCCYLVAGPHMAAIRIFSVRIVRMQEYQTVLRELAEIIAFPSAFPDFHRKQPLKDLLPALHVLFFFNETSMNTGNCVAFQGAGVQPPSMEHNFHAR